MNFFNKKIFDDSLNSFGLDLSDLSVKIIHLSNDGSSDLVASFSSVPIPVGCIGEGEIKNKIPVVEAIKKCVDLAVPKKLKTENVICSLPETKAFLRIISVPKMNEDEIGEAIKWEMEANIPLSLDQVYYDWQIIPSLSDEKEKIQILVVAVAKNTVDQVIEVLEMAGLNPVGLEIESIAQARSLLKEEVENKTVLIVDIGDRRTSFSICKNGVPCFTSSIPLCGQSLTEVIANGMGISFEEAEKLKISYGIGTTLKNEVIFNLTQPVLKNFVQEIERSMDFYISVLKYSQNIDRIVICGGGANTKGIVPYISRELKREIEIGNPWVNLNFGKNVPIVGHDSSIQFSTAIGLALKAKI